MKLVQKSMLILFMLLLTNISTTANGMGMMSIFNGEPTAPQCRNCHYNLDRFPTLGLNLGLRNPDRHHLLVGTTIPPISRSKAPNALGANNSGQPYKCLSCHKLELNVETGVFKIVEPFRDCLQCHPAWIVTGGPMGGMMGGGGRNVHMDQNPLFRQRQCGACHGAGQGRDTDGDGLSDWPNTPYSGGGRGGMGGRR